MLIKKVIYFFKTDGFIRALFYILKYPVRKWISHRRKIKVLSFDTLQDRFTEIYCSNYWGSEESRSGKGSTVESTENLRKKLPVFFEKFAIHSLFDAPCGDFNYMKMVVDNSEVKYVGGDIVASLISQLAVNNKNKQVTFMHFDITKSKFPVADLWFCRDCLFHLSYADIFLALQNFINSDIAYLLTTTHKNLNRFKNHDIRSGDFRCIDLFAEPFWFPRDVLYRIDDWMFPDVPKEMCLWTREQVINVVNSYQ